ncbi:MAG: hypothetical protein PHQ96_06140 [Candidatus Omnitrophica bacterium]|nr:hypothetical protein [Candidatus Omnitrophota bacterium]
MKGIILCATTSIGQGYEARIVKGLPTRVSCWTMPVGFNSYIFKTLPLTVDRNGVRSLPEGGVFTLAVAV